MSTPTHYDAIVIGSGQGGTPLAKALAQAGRRTALIESKHIGGTCINEGCTPTKTMVASARIAHLAGHAQAFGVNFKKSSLTLNMETVRKRKRDIVDSFRTGSENRLKDVPNLDVIMGKARFTGPKTVEVTANDTGMSETFTADQFFINAGCSPSTLNVKNADTITGNLLDSTSIMELGEVPRHLVVIGGGAVGCEFAQMMKRFGARVSLVQRASHLLPREDPEISEEVHKIFTDGGIDVFVGAETREVSNVTLGQIVVSLGLSDGSVKSLLCSHVLAATGRSPNTTDLGMSAAGVELDKHGFIKVDEHLQTTAPGIYALGDIKGGAAQTHVSYDDFRVLRDNLITKADATGKASIENRLIPYTVFIDPQLGRVGMTEKEARALTPARNIKVAKMPMEYVARALEMDESKGLMKAVVDADTKEVLGFACLGIEGGEIMSMVQLAMMGGLTYDELENAMFAHPCLSESLNNLWGFLE
ncbi:mercuric reductase [Exophiala viscosa]|uniref:Mercuric reductase n=1 Tax=Exophiala viscosa TaxID=2486360 RepID=A0AAN6IF85_9EURO|nr:mercuric reductase [Exophiala viscosa]KAI1624262.1 mercuric reductase [Exophiala viscosa]